MRKIVAVLVVASLAFVLFGCGGAAEEPVATETPEAAPAPAAAPVEVTDRSPVESGTPEPFPSTLTTEVPSAIQSKLDAKQPIAIYFYDSSLPESKVVRKELDAVLAENRGLIDLVAFDLGASKAGVSTEAARAGASLASDLRVAHPPYIILIDDGGWITWRWAGYVDRDVISREVLRATE